MFSQKQILKHLVSFWKFSRPHTIIGTHLQIFTAYVLAYEAGPSINHSINIFSLFLVWLSAVSMNVYVVGINQIIDVPVDKINKPDLPLAAGDFSTSSGKVIVALAGILAILPLPFLSVPFSITVISILLIGSAYSLPPIQLKKHPLLAALGISCARGLIFNIGLYLHFSVSFGNGLSLSFPAQALALFTFIFCIVIAIMKDIPDIQGDHQHGIKTLAVRMGPKYAYRISLSILLVSYAFFIFMGPGDWTSKSYVFFTFSHIAIFCFLLFKSFQVDARNKVQIYAYYMNLWKVFYLEFFVFLFSFGVIPLCI